MNTRPELSFRQDSMVWVWDSTWLPAIVARNVQPDRVLVRLQHGVTFSVPQTNLAARDPACRGGDIPSFRYASLHAGEATTASNKSPDFSGFHNFGSYKFTVTHVR